MTFGIAILTPPKSRKAYGATYDCGKHGRLRVSEIAKLAGITPNSVRFRLQQGVKGEDLCKPYRSNDRRKSGNACRHPVVLVAVKLARAFPAHAPTTREIQSVHPMSRQSASRYRQAFRDVLGRAS